MKQSKYQEQIIQGIDNQVRRVKQTQKEQEFYIESAIINAYAGSGKSTTAVMIAKQLKSMGFYPCHVLFSAFTNKNKEGLNDKLVKSIDSNWNITKTLNSAAFSVLRQATDCNRFNIKSYKYKAITTELGYIAKEGKSYLTKNSLVETDNGFISLLNHLRSFYMDCTPENIKHLSKIYKLGIKKPNDIADIAHHVLSEGFNQGVEDHYIDFIDQMWIPVVQALKFNDKAYIEAFEFNQKEIILIDEAQDTSMIQMLVTKLLTKTLIIAVGDSHQAVYAFNGCLSDGMQQWENMVNKTIHYELPINYRCGKSHIQLVNDSFGIPLEAHDKAKNGTIKQAKFSEFTKLFEDRSLTYLILSRMNSSLVLGALTCLSHDIPAKIKNLDLGNKVVNEVQKVINTLDIRYSPDTFIDDLELYREIKRKDYMTCDEAEALITTMLDITEAVKLLFEKYRPKSLKGKTNSWKTCINKIFVDSNYNAPIAFNTIHGGKGGEAEVSVILFPEKMPLIFKNQGEEERQQEMNLCYVACTRSKVNDNPNSGQLILVNKHELVVPNWFKGNPILFKTKDNPKIVNLFDYK